MSKIGKKLFILLAVFALAGNSWAVEVDYHGGWSVLSGGTASTSEAHLGTGAWQGNPSTPYFEWYFYVDTQTFPSQTIQVEDIQSISYWTKDGPGAPYPSSVDFFLALYTKPGVHNHGWYGDRINAEPLYANNYSHGAGWNQWSTGPGTNELTWADHNHGPTGGYNGATWANIVSGPITWSDYFPTGSPTPINYATQDVMLIKVGTGSAWNGSFDGFVDEITLTLTPAAGGNTITFDLEGGIVQNVTQSTTHNTINQAVIAANPGDHIVCGAGTFPEDVLVNKSVQISGAGIDQSIIRGVIGGDGATVRMAAVGSVLEGFTITRDGNNLTQWNLATLNSAGVAIQGTGGAIIRNNKFTGNRTGIDINFADNNQILNNIIDFNRTGMIFRNSCLNNIVEENLITNNWTVGALWLNVGNPNNYATGCTFFNNSISGNWYAQVENRDIISADVRDFSGNWLGTNSPTTAGTDGAEPGYSALIPVEFGGTSTNPGGAITVRGAGLASVDYTPWLNSGSDTNIETSLGRGTVGFQGNYSNLWVDDIAAQTAGIVQEAVNLVSGSTINLMPGTYIGQVHAANFTNLNIIGSGVANTFIKAPATAMTDWFDSDPLVPVVANYPIVYFDSSTANISNLTIDGDGKGNLQYRFIGLAYWNSSGDVNNVDIVHVRNTPLDGGQHGVGLYVNHDVAGSYDVDVTNVNISDFQKNGTVFAGAGTNVDCDSVNITGAGPLGLSLPAQNGFQYSPNTTGTLVDCLVDGIVYTAPSWVATSILLWGDVDLTNTSVANGHVGLYGIDADITVDGGTFTSTNVATSYPKFGITFYSTGAALAANRPMPQPIDASANDFSREGDRSLDANEVVVIDKVEVIGDGSAGGYGVSAYVDGDNLDLTMTDSKVAYWNYGVDYTAAGGTIATAVVTGSTLINDVNTYDNTSGHTWDSNCYSDFTSNGGFPTQYNVAGGGGNVDANPNPNGCSDVNFIVSDPLIGCDAPCNTTLLYITLDAAGLPNLQLVFTLPAGFSTVGGIVTPGSNVDPNLLNAYATVSGQVVTVDMGFQDPGSTGDNTKYVACFTLTNTGAGTGVHTVYGNSSLWIDGLGGNHVNELLLGSIDITVDCTDPAAPATFINTGTCAYGSGYMPADVFSVTGLTAGGGAALQTVWLTANGNASPTYLITLVGTDPYDFTFPAPGTEASFYDLLDDLDGCNTLNLHVTDAECNTAVFDLLNVGWDATPPTLSVTDGITGCYNASTGAAALLGLDIDVSALSALNCRATSGTLTITSITNPGGTPFTFPLSGDLADFPGLANNAALWSWMITNGQGNVPATANGEPYTFSVTAGDCAGNVSLAQTWDICLDFTTPGNTVSTFDARPADGGVWLNWAWSPDVSQAVEMRIYRSPISGGYPAYNPPLRDSYDTSPAALAGWTLVETQIIGSGQVSSATETDANNRGDYAQHTTYWLDAQGGWEAGETLPNGNTEGPDATTWRDIYRYVTFVRDAGGNWSTGYAPVQGTNVDRSTNYWLGDFSPADDNGSNNSRGRVDTDDLTLLSAVYFSNVVGDYRNIGPVVLPAENGNVGKSIPNPDTLGFVSFQDLVPFSFNFNMVSPVGTFATEFVVEPDPTVYRPFNRLDAMPVVDLSITEDPSLEVGSEFTVVVSLANNESDVVKAAEAILTYCDALEVVSTNSASAVASEEGTLFAKAAAIEGNNQIGFVAASCGGWTTLEGNSTLGTVTFRVKSEITGTCEIELTSVQLFDNTGEIIEIEGETIPLSGVSTLPTSYALYQNYPNPFNPTTNIQFDLKDAGHVKIMVFNTLGQVVATIADRELEAGRHTVSFDASNLASGLYLYSINVNGFSDLKKMVLIR